MLMLVLALVLRVVRVMPSDAVRPLGGPASRRHDS